MKRHLLSLLRYALICILSLNLYSCETEDSDYHYEGIETNDVDAPSFDKYLTTSTTDGFSVRLRFYNGGDSIDNMSCTLYWKAYSSKPSSTPSKRDLTNVDYMRIYDHNSRKTTFDESHAGYSGGKYIYYYAECNNSAGSCETSVTYTIIKR